MYRRVVALLLLPCVPLTQSAACGHHHHGREPAGHDQRPHVHLCQHTHEHHGHKHNHPHNAPEPDSTPAAPTPLHEHDCDAIYVAVDVTAPGRAQGVDHDDHGSCWLSPSPGVVFCQLNDARAYAPQWAHPPPLAPDCPLYLLHLALLF
jgi:hypothetical protein